MSDAATPPLSSEKSAQRAQAAVQCLSHILGSLPSSLASSENPAAALLHDESVTRDISRRLRGPSAGAGDDNLCRWLYDTFQSNDADLQLIVLNFTPIVAGVYLSRAVSRQPFAGFEAVLLALYAHETVIRGGKQETVKLPNLANPSVYGHETKAAAANKAKTPAEPATAVISPALEPYGTMRSTKRARIVGVALELYHSKISLMSLASKLAFCEFCLIWAGQEDAKPEIAATASAGREVEQAAGKSGAKEEHGRTVVGRVPMPWELFQPAVRVVGHCLMSPLGSKELKAMAYTAVEQLYRRATHDMEPEVILATRSLLRVGKMDDAIAEPNIAANMDESQIEALRVKAKMT